MNRLFKLAGKLLMAALMVMALLVAAALMLFPAVKGVWLGYVALAAGGLAAWYAGRFSWERRLEALSRRVFLLLALGLPAAIQVVLVLVLRSEARLDGLFVLEQARAFVSTGVMDPLTYYPPGQTWYYAPFIKLFGGSTLTAQLCQVPLAVLVVFLVYVVGRMVMGEGSARAAALASACYPSAVMYILVTPYYFYLYTCMILAALYCWIRVLQRDDANFAFISGVVCAVGALVKPVMLIAPVLASGLWLLEGGGFSRKWLRWVLLLAVGFGLTMFPWVKRNHDVLGEPVPVCTSGGLVLYSANNPDSNGLYSPIPDRVEIDDPREMAAYSRECSEKAKAFMKEQPLKFMKLVLLKHLHSWGNETTYGELVNFRGRTVKLLDMGVSFAAQAGWAAVVFAWLVVMLRCRISVDVFPIAVSTVVLSNWLVYLVFEGGARHHLPMVPLLVLLILYARAQKQAD